MADFPLSLLEKIRVVIAILLSSKIVMLSNLLEASPMSQLISEHARLETGGDVGPGQWVMEALSNTHQLQSLPARIKCRYGCVARLAFWVLPCIGSLVPTCAGSQAGESIVRSVSPQLNNGSPRGADLRHAGGCGGVVHYHSRPPWVVVEMWRWRPARAQCDGRRPIATATAKLEAIQRLNE
ncbi:hypothetical protein CC78DRAFT_584465 [Lojkania enalia]|uniref:Uncharacterized protein n=1 Tax=Lojkania enalia TaxID=147567 RepID=A0A9P4K7A8_9PLEO|nr:hypothetical protein CC78DRAFT_584465 [Didymosphaeria enalia]